MLDKMVVNELLEFMHRDEVRQVLLRRHTHQYEQARLHKEGSQLGSQSQGGFFHAVRSIGDIGKTFSHGKNIDRHKDDEQNGKKPTERTLALPKVGSLPREIGRDGLHSDASKGNIHFMKKLPIGAEASNVLIGEVDFLQHIITAFVRLKNATLLGDLTEVPVPTRFLFIMLGPIRHSTQFKEIGRVVATLMSDEIFHDVAYKARNRGDLLDGLDEFLDQVTVLPPGEWDSNIRIEPPMSMPEKRKLVGKGDNSGDAFGGENGTLDVTGLADDDEGGHGIDPALKRTGRLFGGLLQDIKRKRPFCLSDYKDALNMQCLATFFFMYFALLAPIVTFGGLLSEATHKNMAAMENLLAGCICGVIYHIFSGQSLTIIGSTGPVLVFETIIFDLCQSMGLPYLAVRFWINLWTAIILLVMVATDASSLVSFITRFTEESFATLIALIFIYEAVMKLWAINRLLKVTSFDPTGQNATCTCTGPANRMISFDWVNSTAAKRNWDLESAFVRDANGHVVELDHSKVDLSQCEPLHGVLQGVGCYRLYDVFLMSLILMLGTFFLAMVFKLVRNSRYFPSRVRQVVSDFAVMLAIVLMTTVDIMVGIDTPKLYVPSTFRPTLAGRGWVVMPFDGISWWVPLLSVLPAMLACILIFMDQQITAVIVNRKENKLNKGCGYHLDLFILSLLILLVAILGLPIYVAATVLSINHVNSLRVESQSRAPGEPIHFIGVREQRITGIVTFLFIGLSIFVTGILSFIPMPVLYGVFMYMGIAALGGIQLFDRLLLILMPMKYQPDAIYIRHVPINTIHKFTGFQVGCLIVLWIIKSIKTTSIVFPIMLVAMVGVRKLMEKCFSEHDLKYLDDKMPDFHLRKREDAKKGVSRKASENEDKDGDEMGEGLRTVKTAGHLHIPMASGNIMKIPLCSIEEERFNLSKEVNQSGLWKHLASESQSSLPKLLNGNRINKSESPPKLVSSLRRRSPPVDEDNGNGPITIKLSKASPQSSMIDEKTDDSSHEHLPLLQP